MVDNTENAGEPDFSQKNGLTSIRWIVMATREPENFPQFGRNTARGRVRAAFVRRLAATIVPTN